jgi:hypothetical protein
MNEVRMEHTEGLGRAADVWVDGALLTCCDGISTFQARCVPGLLEAVKFRYTADESISWDEAVRKNSSMKITIEPLKGWSYLGYGRVEQVMPVVIHFGLLKMEDPNWSTDERLVGKFVCVPIDRLEIIPADEEE